MKKNKLCKPIKNAPGCELASETVEVFNDPIYIFSILRNREPFYWNQGVHVYKYKVTVERVHEQQEVIFDRIKQLYLENKRNIHAIDAIRNFCKRNLIDFNKILKS
jgi:hypothetical protein